MKLTKLIIKGLNKMSHKQPQPLPKPPPKSLQNTPNPDFKFSLGSICKDAITGFEGVIIARTQYLTNCNTYGVKANKLLNDLPMETQWFDEPNLILTLSDVHEAHQETGGPTEAPRMTNRQ